MQHFQPGRGSPQKPSKVSALVGLPLFVQEGPVDLHRQGVDIARAHAAGREMIGPAFDRFHDDTHFARRIAFIQTELPAHRQGVIERRIGFPAADTHLLVAQALSGGQHVEGRRQREALRVVEQQGMVFLVMTGGGLAQGLTPMIKARPKPWEQGLLLTGQEVELMADQSPNKDRQDPNMEVPGDTNSADIVGRTGEEMPLQSHDGVESDDRSQPAPATDEDNEDLDGYPV